MKIGTWAKLLFAAAPLLAGCGNFWQPPGGGSGGGGGCTTNCTKATSGDFYILNSPTSGSPTIVGESIVTGTLTAIPGSPWAVESSPYAIAMAPNGKFLIVSTTTGTYAYPISSGVLETATLVSTDQAYAIQVDKTNSWLVEAIPGTGGVQMSAISINPATGAFITGSPVRTAAFAVANAAVQQNKMVISPDNSYVFLALGAGGTIAVPFNSSAPFPSGITAYTIAVLNTGGSALSVAVDPRSTPRLFYIGETLAGNSGNSGGLRAFTYASLGTSTLVNATGSPIASGGLAPNFILPVSTPDFVYVANGAGTGTAGNIAGFSITAASGPTYTIAAGSTVAAGVQPLGLAEDSTDTFVLTVGSLGSPYFDSYTFDTTTTGQLDSQITSTTAAGSIAIVAAP
ncbi:MAG: hypothetical protein ABSC47_10820 [Terracidiphilus sp.]|jgi:hypothetical protein